MRRATLSGLFALLLLASCEIGGTHPFRQVVLDGIAGPYFYATWLTDRIYDGESVSLSETSTGRLSVVLFGAGSSATIDRVELVNAAPEVTVTYSGPTADSITFPLTLPIESGVNSYRYFEMSFAFISPPAGGSSTFDVTVYNSTGLTPEFTLTVTLTE